MKVVNIHEAKNRFSELLAEIEQSGSKIRICRNGKPVADLVSCKPCNRLIPHSVMSRINIKYDPTEPLSETEWPDN